MVPIVRGEGEGERLWFAGGGVFTMKATAREADGAFVLSEDKMVRGKTTPLHNHPNMDETLIVLEGEILVYAEGTEHRVGPRGVAVAPRRAPHAFMVTPESALVLMLQTPGSGRSSTGMQASRRDSRNRPWEAARLGSPAGGCGWLWAAAERHPEIIQILGPPPFEAA
jgi:quercetin dioxygenase-like cupin family protein